MRWDVPATSRIICRGCRWLKPWQHRSLILASAAGVHGRSGRRFCFIWAMLSTRMKIPRIRKAKTKQRCTTHSSMPSSPAYVRAAHLPPRGGVGPRQTEKKVGHVLCTIVRVRKARQSHQTNAGSGVLDQDDPGLGEPLPPGAGRVVDRGLIIGSAWHPGGEI